MKKSRLKSMGVLKKDVDALLARACTLESDVLKEVEIDLRHYVAEIRSKTVDLQQRIDIRLREVSEAEAAEKDKVETEPNNKESVQEDQQ